MEQRHYFVPTWDSYPIAIERYQHQYQIVGTRVHLSDTHTRYDTLVFVHLIKEIEDDAE